MLKLISVASIHENGEPFKKVSTDISKILNFISVTNLTWIECVVDDIVNETPMILKKLGIELDPSSLLSGYLTSYEDIGDTLGIMLPLIVTGSSRTQTSPLLIFVKKNMILTIHDDYGGKINKLHTYSTMLLRKLPQDQTKWTDRQTLLLFRLMDEVSESNFLILRFIVEKTEQLEVDLTESRQLKRDLSLELSNMKRSVLTFLNAIWATHDIIRNVKYGDSEMLTDDDDVLEKFEVILSRLDRQIQTAENVMDVISTGMIVIQTETSNKLTTLIVWLTVVATAVLVPNTLATIFGIPNLHTQFTLIIPILITATALSTIITYRYTKEWRSNPFTINKIKNFKKKFS